MQTEESISRLSADDVVELIKENRNDFIEKLMNNDSLRQWLGERFELESISVIKMEFIKRALKELSISPVDLSHYSSLILEIRKVGSMSITKNNDSFFFRDVEKTIKNYV